MSAAIAVILALIELATGHEFRRDLIGRLVQGWLTIACPMTFVSEWRWVEAPTLVIGIALLVVVIVRRRGSTSSVEREDDEEQDRSRLLREAREVEEANRRWRRAH